MSGIGKTWLALKLAEWGWHHYSCDVEIAEKYLKSTLEKTLGKNHQVQAADISSLSQFVGRLGDPDKGGLELAEFRKRQSLYLNAERQALQNIPLAMARTQKPLVVDSTGSLCEITDEEVKADLGQRTLFVYIKAIAEDEHKILQRTQDYPKPLIYPSAQFGDWLSEYMEERDLAAPKRIDPDDFSRWIFPKLYRSRLPKYQRLADLYGITISSDALNNIKSGEDFQDMIATFIDHKINRRDSAALDHKYVEIFTDGACSGNPGPGGWGAVMRYGGHEREVSGGEKETTNNRMEMMAVIESLRALNRPSKVKLYTDSKYVMEGITRWLEGWKARGWKTADKKPVKNQDLWEQMEAEINRHDVEFIWVKGHAGHPENERADALARGAIPAR